MNALINDDRVYGALEEKKENDDKASFGELFATIFVALYTLSALTVSSWSAIVYLTDSIESEVPLEHIFKLVQMTGIL